MKGNFDGPVKWMKSVYCEWNLEWEWIFTTTEQSITVKRKYYFMAF